MTTIPNPVETSESTVGPQGRSARWLNRIDDWSERFGDAVNPILVKETRQALKSRQFLFTFSTLLLAALGWTVIGCLSMMPQIYHQPSAPTMLIGYYFVLAVPLLLIVPLAAYRSLEVEIDDGTLELLSITSLSAWQIVLGKLASASLQMMLYFVALLPCVAFAYTLRGVDLPTTLLIIGILAVSAMLLTIVGLFLAPLARGRTGRISTMLVAIAAFMIAEWSIGYVVIEMISQGYSLETETLIYAVVATALLGIGIGHLLLTATAAQLTPESDNRSTPLRLSLLMLGTIVVGLIAYAIQMSDENVAVFSLMAFTTVFAGLWVIASSMLVAESSVMTPRMLRELPSSFLARNLLTAITPGPNSGLIFATVVAIAGSVLFLYGLEVLIDNHPRLGGARVRPFFQRFVMLYVGYLVSFLVCVRVIVAGVRLKANPRADVGIAVMIVVLLVSALLPLAIGLQLNDFREFGYSPWQITNWAWTMMEAERGLKNKEEYWVVAAAAGLFGICLATMSDTVLPRKIATPLRVKEEKAKGK